VAETNVIRVRYWAAAKAAAGTDSDDVLVTGPTTLAELRAAAAALHPGTRLSEVLAACSTLVGEQPVGLADPASYVVDPGATVEFLPPFAGGAGTSTDPAC
jgi:molybdopterin synthase sulfur carrier subunit